MTPQELNHKLMIIRAQKNVDELFSAQENFTETIRCCGCELQKDTKPVAYCPPSDFALGFICGAAVMALSFFLIIKVFGE